MTCAPRNHGDSQEEEQFCYILYLFKQTKCVDRKLMNLQIQIEDTEYQEPEERICENIVLWKPQPRCLSAIFLPVSFK